MNRRGLLLTALVSPAAGLLSAAPASASVDDGTDRLTNLSHLDFLRDEVAPAPQPGHTTYRLAESPRVGVLWTYAERQPDGTMRRVGGGRYDPDANTWGQGAYNADDMARAAVVYLRHWRQTGAVSSRDASYALLRGLTYLQTASGPNAGNVVLWMQPDGTLNPSADPKDAPDPSDSGPSYWLARTVWALGEGYAAWRDADPAFAAFLSERMDLAVAALDRQVLVRYGSWQVVDGDRAPAWLIVDGADATAEAVLGLAAYVEAGGNANARQALRRFADGIAALSGGDARHWPFGAVRPWAVSLSVWHAWASQMPAALARAGAALRVPALVRPAVTDSAVFTPWLLTSGGPDNGRLPTPVDRTQIAYGVDSRVQSLLAVADATGRTGFRRLAGVVAAWFFGANPAGLPAYDPSTGRTIDGIGGDGKVNHNSGAESTIHCLLTMLALDAHPDVAAIARRSTVVERVGTSVVEAEQGEVAGGATAVIPPSAWTGEASYSGGYVSLPPGAAVRLRVPPAEQPRRVIPVVDLREQSGATTTWKTDGRLLGRLDHGRVGAQGGSPAPGALLPVTLPGELPARATDLTAVAAGGDAVVDAVLLEPLLSRLVLAGDGGVALLRSSAREPRQTQVEVPGTGQATVEVYDADGALRERRRVTGSTVTVTVLAGGFTIVRR
ncbi:hypothetical protein HC031_12885 [Planosporangium thailandense]|uniref:Uncharacterized protein n=1 Tax=Planosporangium thailandense TaxID=765197 RepID=A0ABX0XZD0_9ACTN|nr:hypothetical protein [Planosporangium thailandense]NJC70602.1 hypothetical protein [Planosporangium thailandense]